MNMEQQGRLSSIYASQRMCCMYVPVLIPNTAKYKSLLLISNEIFKYFKYFSNAVQTSSCVGKTEKHLACEIEPGFEGTLCSHTLSSS